MAIVNKLRKMFPLIACMEEGNPMYQVRGITSKTPKANKGQRPAPGIADTKRKNSVEVEVSLNDVSPNQLMLWPTEKVSSTNPLTEEAKQDGESPMEKKERVGR